MKISKSIKIYMLTDFIEQTIIWFAGPTIMIYFAHQIGALVQGRQQLIAAVVGVVVVWLLNNRKIIQWGIKHYWMIAIVNFASYFITNVIYMHDAAMRMYMMALFQTAIIMIDNKLWSAKFNLLASGEEKTMLDSKLSTASLSGKLVGCLMASVSYCAISPETAIWLNVWAIGIFAIIDSYIFYKLDKEEAKSEVADKEIETA